MRETGYYWVKVNGKSYLGGWNGDRFLFHPSMNFDNVIIESVNENREVDPNVILPQLRSQNLNETRIKNPDEK